MKLLDLFCGAGGCSKGYELAGFDKIVGVDIVKQPHYPYKFIQYDALEFLEDEDLGSYDLIHASPPCQGYCWSASQWGKNYPKLITPLREILTDKCCDYVIENVQESDLISPIGGSLVVLEGNMFDLPIKRTRLFECSFSCYQPKLIKRTEKVLVTLAGHGGQALSCSLDNWKLATNIWWMNKKELTQAIPPAYTKYIGKQFLEQYEG